MTIAWDQASGDLDGYMICHYPQGAVSTPLDNGLTRQIRLSGLEVFTTYYVKVFSYMYMYLGTLESDPATLQQTTG